MADRSEDNGAGAPAAKQRGLVPMIGVAVAALAIGAGGAWFLKPASGDAPKGEAGEHAEESAGADADGGEHDGAAAADAPAPLSERLVTLDPFVVNLDENGAKRFLRTRIELETESPVKQAELVTRSAQMRDAIIVLLTSKRLEDLGGLEGKVILKNEIQRRLDDLLGPGAIRSVLITEFVIQ